MLILKTLTRGTMHGYGIVEFIQQSSDDVLRVEKRRLYPRSIASNYAAC
jgi:DNA-binding PadR family transcriptional regulator